LPKNLEIHTLVDSIDVSATVAVGLGDANWDGMVDDTDLDICIDAFGTQPYMSGWNPDCDFNNDDLIDGRDVSFIAENYGETIEVSTTPFTIALVSGTYTLRAKYTDQIINKIVNVVEGTLTRVDILF